MRKLTEVIFNMIFPFERSGYLVKDGMSEYGDEYAHVAKAAFSYTSTETYGLPRKVLEHFIRKGVSRDDFEKILVYENHLTLKRLSDGKEDTFTLTDFSIYFQRTTEKTMEKLYMPFPEQLNFSWGYIMEPEEFAGLVRFLREAGVEFEPDVLPWMEDALRMEDAPTQLEAKPKPSERLGKEAARFFGFE